MDGIWRDITNNRFGFKHDKKENIGNITHQQQGLLLLDKSKFWDWFKQMNVRLSEDEDESD